jgi:SAM-dependent methyltransferase
VKRILDLGSGLHPTPEAFTVDFDEAVKPDLVFDLRNSFIGLAFALPYQKWDEIHCKNVINYFPNLNSVERLFLEVNYLLAEGGRFYLEFMNYANKEGLRLHYYTVKRLLDKTGFESRLETKRHLLVPTGNVRIAAWKK